MITPFDYQPRTRLLFGPGTAGRLGDLAREAEWKRTLLVADQGIVDAGHFGRASRVLERAGIAVIPFHDFDANPDSEMVERGRAHAARHSVDSIVGLGGGSSMDCAKGINFVLTNGGSAADYQGYGKAGHPLLPMIGIPTTAGTGSEAQSYALISDARAHVKMACGDPKAAFRIAILDPELTASQPRDVRAATGYDAISHAVESFVTTRRNPISICFAREAWRLLSANFERVVRGDASAGQLGAMQLGAFYAGTAIENSMLGATHACANPLTARYGLTHGVAIAILLPHVVRWNEAAATSVYCDLDGPDLTRRLEELAVAAGFPRTLRGAGISRDALPCLAAEAAAQWTGRFNPRPFDGAGALEIYECAF